MEKHELNVSEALFEELVTEREVNEEIKKQIYNQKSALKEKKALFEELVTEIKNEIVSDILGEIIDDKNDRYLNIFDKITYSMTSNMVNSIADFNTVKKLFEKIITDLSLKNILSDDNKLVIKKICDRFDFTENIFSTCYKEKTSL